MNVINLLSGPGCGKSTTAAGLFHKMKLMGLNVELVTEYIKGAVFEGRTNIFNDQIYIFAKQHRRQFILQKECDWVITDSPILLSAVYAPENYYPSFESLVLEAYYQYNNFNFFIERKKKYVNLGRRETKEEAIAIDKRILKFLDKHKLPFIRVTGDDWTHENVLHGIDRTLGWTLYNKVKNE